ncbi:MAG: hypothetical protein H0W58_16415 [Acidobacteria bacterium]|nr:hypothetical protein [Acidobacteriota bacterium]
MKKTILVYLSIFFLIFQASFASAQINKKADVRQIEVYCKTIDRLIKRHKNPQLVFADVSQNDKPKWRKFASEKSLEKFRENTETYTIAYNWQKNGRIVMSNFTLFSGSGDWVQYVYHYFREDGTLAKAESELRTFHGNLIVSQDFYFDKKGKLLKKTLKYLDLQTQKPTKPIDEFVDAHADFLKQTDYFKKTSKLPFAHLLKRK